MTKCCSLTLLLVLQAGLAAPLLGQAAGRPVGWRYPQAEIKGGSFYAYPSPEKTKGPFELITKWSVPADRALIGDVNGDGKLELVTQSGNKVSVYSGQRVLLSTASVPGDLRLGALQDVNGDKIDDILLAGRVDDALVVVFLKGRGSVIRRLSINGQKITDLEQDKANMFGAEIHGLADIDADGRQEAILSLSSGHFLRPRGVLALDAVSGAKKWYYPVGPGITQVLLQDINRNGLPDVLASGYSLGNSNIAPDSTNDHSSFLYSLRQAGRANWITKTGEYNSGVRIAVQDIDRDSTEEIVISAYKAWQYLPDPAKDVGYLATLNGLSGDMENIVVSSKSLDDRGLVVTNTVGSGQAEIAVGGREGIVRKYDSKLKFLGSYASTGPVSVLAGNDFRRTGKPDFFAVTDTNNLLLLDNDLNLVSSFEYPSGGRQVTLLISDLIPGGSNELVLVSDEAHVLTVAAKLEDQFSVSYKVLKDLPVGQLTDLKRLGAAVVNLTIKNKTGREALFRVRHGMQNLGKEQILDGVEVLPGGEKEVELFPELQPGLAPENNGMPAAYSVVLEFARPDGSYQTLSAREMPVRLHSRNRFFPLIKDAAGKDLNLLASLVNWVDPQSPEVEVVIGSASQMGRSEDPIIKIVGPQRPGAFRGAEDTRSLAERDSDYLDQIELAYRSLEKVYGVTYKSTPMVLKYKAGSSQKVLFPGETAQKSGNCIDNAVLFASILESMEFNPLLVLLPYEGHAIVGWMFSGDSGTGATAYKYHFLDTNKFSPEIPFKTILKAGQTWADRPAIKPLLSGPIPFKNGIFGTPDGAVVILDVAAIKEQISD